MLIKIEQLELGTAWSEPSEKYEWQIEDRFDVYINPERVAFVRLDYRAKPPTALIRVATIEMFVSPEDAQRVIDSFNGTTPAAAPAAGNGSSGDAPAGDEILVHLTEMRQDSFYSKTAQAVRRMWRCATKEGYAFNIFDHVDHRNTYILFKEFAMWMDEMQQDDVLDWSKTPIPVYLKRNGDFFNPVRVELPDHEMRPELIPWATAEGTGDDE